VIWLDSVVVRWMSFVAEVPMPSRIEMLIETATSSTDADEVDRAIRQVLGSEEPGIVDALVQNLRHVSVSVRRRSAGLLAKIGAKAAPALPGLVAALESDPVWSVREAVVQTMTAISTTDQECESVRHSHLKVALLDPDLFVREMARNQLLVLDINWTATIRTLKENFQQGRPHVQCRAILALGQFSRHLDDWSTFVDALNAGHWKVRRAALMALEQMPVCKAAIVGEVIRRCFDQNSSVCRTAFRTLERHRACLPRLIKAALIPSQIQLGSDDHLGKNTLPWPDEVLESLLKSDQLTEGVVERFVKTCERRTAWHKKRRAVTSQEGVDKHSTWNVAGACVRAATGTDRSGRARHREFAWLLSKLCKLLLSMEAP